MSAKSGEPVVAQREIPTALRIRHIFSTPVNGLSGPLVKDRKNIIPAPTPQVTGITKVGPMPTIIALEAIRQSWMKKINQVVGFGIIKPLIVSLIKMK